MANTKRHPTLYRHFPTREELLVAVYRSEMEKLAAAEQSFAVTLPPVEALRAWLLQFVDTVETKQIIAPVLNALVGDPKKVFEAWRINSSQEACMVMDLISKSTLCLLLIGPSVSYARPA
jgi:AcrR family transcriptional regulator